MIVLDQEDSTVIGHWVWDTIGDDPDNRTISWPAKTDELTFYHRSSIPPIPVLVEDTIDHLEKEHKEKYPTAYSFCYKKQVFWMITHGQLARFVYIGPEEIIQELTISGILHSLT